MVISQSATSTIVYIQARLQETLSRNSISTMAATSGKKFATELSDYSSRRQTTGPYADDLDVDVLIVGGGFGKSPSKCNRFCTTVARLTISKGACLC